MADSQDTPSGFAAKKKVDESWKDNIEKEKGYEGHEDAKGVVDEPSFSSFLSTLGTQAFFSLGEFQDPASPEIKTDLAQAKYLIDVIQILSDKTNGNLSEEEGLMIKELLYGLKMKFVEKSTN